LNHLAHFLVSNGSAGWTGGAIAADEIRGPAPAGWPADAKRAVTLHRHLDAFTDAHPIVRKTRGHFPSYRHYARVLADVYYDHVLALHFERFSSEPLERFTQRVYGELQASRGWLPEPLNASIPRMIADDFLVRYRTREHVVRTLARLSSRFRRRVDLTSSFTIYEAARTAIDEEALQFLVEMIIEAQRYRQALTESARP
jgi:acyl carrier protein phosphodiesterase